MEWRQQLVRLANPFVAWILRSRFHALLSRDMLLLTFTGRKSGRAYTTPVSYVRDGHVVTFFTHSPWWKNLRGSARVTMRIRGRDHHGKAEVLVGEKAEIARALHDFLSRIPRDAPFYEVKLGPGRTPEPADIERAAGSTVMMRVRLDHDPLRA